MYGLVHIALTRDAAIALFEVAGTPGGIQAVEGDEPVGVVSIVLGFALMMALDVAL